MHYYTSNVQQHPFSDTVKFEIKQIQLKSFNTAAI